jgi:hypothetical protein
VDGRQKIDSLGMFWPVWPLRTSRVRGHQGIRAKEFLLIRQQNAGVLELAAQKWRKMFGIVKIQCGKVWQNHAKSQDRVAVTGDIWGLRSRQASMARQQLVEVDNELSLPHVQKFTKIIKHQLHITSHSFT